MSMQAKKFTQIKSAQAKSVRAVQNKSATRKNAKPAKQAEDEFDRALATAVKAGDFDDIVNEALQDERDGKTSPL